jgi:hypothetical protein
MFFQDIFLYNTSFCLVSVRLSVQPIFSETAYYILTIFGL